MRKSASILCAAILIVYYVFTSGFFYWASGADETMKLVTPFSWALSAKEKGLTTVVSENDVECAKWLMYESDQSMMIVADTNGLFLISGYTELLPDAWLKYGREDRLNIIMDMPKLDSSYLFITEWNMKHKEYVYCSDVGLRGRTQFKIRDSLFIYDVHNIDKPSEIISAVAIIEEIYRCGDSVVYKQSRCSGAE